MPKSILNDGGFKGGKAVMHTRRCALTRVLLWPVRTSQACAAGRKAAVRLSKLSPELSKIGYLAGSPSIQGSQRLISSVNRTDVV